MEVKLAEDPIVHECYNVQQGSPNDIALLKVCSSRTRCYLFNFITPALACWRCWPHRLHPCLPSWTGRWLHRPDGKCLWWVWKAGVEPSFLENLDSGDLWIHFVCDCVLLTGETCKSQITISSYQGWGTTYSCAPSIAPILQEVEVPIVSDTVCEAVSSNSPFNQSTIGGGCATILNIVNYTNLISPDMVCAGSAGKTVHTYYMVIFEQ